MGVDPEFEKFLIDEERFSPITVHHTIQKIQYIFDHTQESTSRDAIQSFIREVWAEKGNGTANQYIKVANRWLKFKKEEPLKYFKAYGNSFTVRLCTPEEKARLLHAASSRGKREKAMFYLLFGTGVRLGEAYSLKVQDIHEDTIKVKGKGQKIREIYLPPETYEAIKEYEAVRVQPSSREDQQYLWTTRAGKRMSYAYFRKLCSDVSLMAGIKFHPHMARHTYATELLKAGVSVLYVSQLLGHENLATTALYLHPSQEDAINQVRNIKFFEKDQKHKDSLKAGPKGTDRSKSAQSELLFLFSYADFLLDHPSLFLPHIDATPHDQTCNTKDATLMRWCL